MVKFTATLPVIAEFGKLADTVTCPNDVLLTVTEAFPFEVKALEELSEAVPEVTKSICVLSATVAGSVAVIVAKSLPSAVTMIFEVFTAMFATKLTFVVAVNPPEAAEMVAKLSCLLRLVTFTVALFPIVVADVAASLAAPTGIEKFTTVPSGTGEMNVAVIKAESVSSASTFACEGEIANCTGAGAGAGVLPPPPPHPAKSTVMKAASTRYAQVFIFIVFIPFESRIFTHYQAGNAL
ncbi:hypothetical protein [Geotalea uraniireducens]|uniref:hypothetical protein n=1 Tax=Geotalea uraniireducens TaxID=351604 RepID=UPI0012EE028B|nr:hypothetical protein [Geotalea uraniireducens]